jgi:SAM-dependent methyltransferase
MMLTLLDIVQRSMEPKPWAEGEKIPWNDPDFSRRMLAEHLSQEHDAASRRFEIIDAHVDWIHNRVLGGKPARILDLGCGPGLYTERLAKLGHRCMGIDFSPASIAFAGERAREAGLDCVYIHQDIRTADYGGPYGLVMSIFGEFNVFRPGEARGILENAFRALAPGGFLLMEPHTYEKVVQLGKQPPAWHSAQKGLFSDNPHLLLQESFWDAETNVAIQRCFVIDAETGGVTRYSSSTQAYPDEGYRSLLTESGFSDPVFYPSLGGSQGGSESGLIAILARKRG